MAQLRTLPLVQPVLAAASVAALCLSLHAQAQTDSPPDLSATHLKVREVPLSVPPKPFAPAGDGSIRTAPVEFHTADQMSEKDRELAADAESSIGERAGYLGLDFHQGKWTYEEMVCPALPNHIFLRYTRNNGEGDVSILTASIPRGGDGRVRIIPIQMRGYSLFSPAPINALTISAFNHIRAEENPDKAPDWLGTGYCYAALAGSRFQEPGSGFKESGSGPHESGPGSQEAGSSPQGPPAKPADSEKYRYPTAVPAMLHIPAQGGAIVEFSTVSDKPALAQWTMTFDRKGRLLKATHLRAAWIVAKAVPQDTEAPKGTPVPPTIQNIDASGNPMQ